MSLTTATPSAASRVGSPRQRSGGRPAGAPRLRVVRDEHRPTATVRRSARSARPVRTYRSDLSVRSMPSTRSTAPGRPAAQVRLTRRGRIVVRIGSAGLAVLALVAGVLLIDRTAEAGSTSRPVPVTYRVVLPGETLWKIAGEVAPEVDRRDTVARILELNALSSAGVKAGQRIAVPITTP
jgi:hypothetical protein